MPYSRPWFLLVIGLLFFTLAPTQAAIIYDDPLPPIKKKKVKKKSKKKHHFFRLFRTKRINAHTEQQDLPYLFEFSIIAGLCFLVALLASIWGFYFLAYPIISIVLIIMNALSLVITSLGFFHFFGPILPIINSILSTGAQLIIIGVVFGFPWLWILTTVVLSLLIFIFLALLLLLFINTSNPPNIYIEKE